LRLALCRIIIKTLSNKLKFKTEVDCLKKKQKIGRAIAEAIEDRETILEIIKTASQIKTNSPIILLKPAIFIERPNNTPKEVAIPLPPLNCKNIVQLWPQIQHNPKRMRKFSPCNKTGLLTK
jgi:hypothetical protein